MENIEQTLKGLFPFTSEALWADIIGMGNLQTAKAGDIVIESQLRSCHIPLVLKGTLRVTRRDEQDDRELFLYFIEAGTTCSNSLNFMLTGKNPQVEAVAEEDVTMWCVPSDAAEQWMHKHPEWMQFVLKSYQNRFEEAMHALDEVAFKKLDERLQNYLKEKARLTNSKIILESHSQIATALHSSREVISRVLKQLEQRGDVKLGRNKITLLG